MCCACEYLKYAVTMAASLGRAGSLMRRIPIGHDYKPPARGLVILAAVAALLSAQSTVDPAVSQRARALHASALVFDGHIHAVDREFYHGGDIGLRKPDGQFDLPRAREGGLGALFFTIFVTEDYYPARLETKQAMRMLDCAIEQIDRNRQTHRGRA